MSSPLTAKDELEKMLGVEKPKRLVSFIAIGKPLKDKGPSNKKPLEGIIEIID